MGVKTIHRCIKEIYLICDKNKNCCECISDENNINEKWIYHNFVIRHNEPEK